jgi:DNA-binding NarL/FixJ family response regulator
VIRVIIVDDHPVVREGLAVGLEHVGEITITGTAGSIAEALRLIERSAPDVLVLDLDLSGEDGLDAIPRVYDLSPDTRILILTAYESDDQVVGALRAGASGYLLKGALLTEIRTAVRKVHAGETYLDARVAGRVARLLRAEGPRITARERDVLTLLHAGRANKEIATALGISERTVKFHVTSILNKLGADNRTHAVALALQQKLI